MEYALYKGDKFITLGSIREIAREMGVKEDTIKYYRTPTYKKRGKTDNRRTLVKLEEEN